MLRTALVARLGPAAGVLGTALILTGLLTANRPIEDMSPADAPAATATAFAANADRTRTGVSIALIGLASLFWFLGWLRQRIRAAEGDGGWLHTVVWGGGLAGAAGLIAYLALLVASSNDAIGGNPEAASTLLTLQWEYGGVLAPAFAALVGATSVAVIRLRLLPLPLAPIAWLGVPLAAGLALAGFLGGALVVTSLFWLLALASALLLHPQPRLPADQAV